jgi:hypothetical protein
MRAVPRLCEFLYPGICLTTQVEARKNLSQSKKNLSWVKKNLSQNTVYILPKYPHITKQIHYKIADKLTRDETALQFVGPEPALGVSRQDIRRRIRRWLVNQHWGWWRGLW